MTTGRPKATPSWGRSLNDLSAEEIIIKVPPKRPHFCQGGVASCHRQCWLSQVVVGRWSGSGSAGASGPLALWSCVFQGPRSLCGTPAFGENTQVNRVQNEMQPAASEVQAALSSIRTRMVMVMARILGGTERDNWMWSFNALSAFVFNCPCVRHFN